MRPWQMLVACCVWAACGGSPSEATEARPNPAETQTPEKSATKIADTNKSSDEPTHKLRLTLDQRGDLDSLDFAGIHTLDLDLLPLPATQTEPKADTDDASVDPCERFDLAALAARASEVRELRVAGCGHVVGQGLTAWTHLERLELADLAIDAATMKAVGELDNLTHLILTRVETGKAPVSLLHHKLEVDHLTLRELATDSALASILGKTPSLRRVDLIGPWAGHRAMLALAGAANLTHLELIDTQVGNFSLNQIKGLYKLNTVELRGSTFNNNTPLYLRELPVESFRCSCPGLGDRGLVALSRVTSLQTIELRHAEIHTRGLQAMKPMPNLQTVLLREHRPEPDGLKALAQHPKLQQLELSCAPGASETNVFTHLGTLTGLTRLVLDCPGVDDRLAKELQTLTALTELDLSHTAISDAGLAPLAAMTGLRELKLHHTRVTNRGLAALAKLDHLELLELDHTDVRDGGVTQLKHLSSLRELRLDHTLVTDQGLASLHGLTRLERLNLDGTVVSEQAAAELAGNLPNLKVLHLGSPRHLPAR